MPPKWAGKESPISKVGKLDMSEHMEDCDRRGIVLISKQVPFRSWCLSAILCSVACITIVCATVWACSIAGLGTSSTHSLMNGNNDVHTENMMNRLLSMRNLSLSTLDQSQNAKLINEEQPSKQKVKSSPLLSGQPFAADNKGLLADRGRMIDDAQNKKNIAALMSKYGNVGKYGKVREDKKNLKDVGDDKEKEYDGVEGKKKAVEDLGKTQISSPEDAVGQLTTNVAQVSSEERPRPRVEEGAQRNQNSSGEQDPVLNGFKLVPEFSDKLKDLADFALAPKSTPGQYDDYYGPDEYFYSELDAASYYSSYEQTTWTGYILEKIQELHDWITSDLSSGGGKKKKAESTIPQILKALNYSIIQGDASILVLKLKDLYYGISNGSLIYDASKGKDILTNTSSPASFGLLALDVMLLRNLQLMGWDDEETAINEVLSDPEIFAMNALFMDTDEVKKVYQQLQKVQTKVWTESKRSPARATEEMDKHFIESLREGLTSNFYSVSSVGQDIIDFTFSTVKAATNLARAFGHSRSKNNKKNLPKPDLNITKPAVNESSTVARAGTLSRSSKKDSNSSVLALLDQSVGGESPRTVAEEEEVTELDCIWTLYCRNLDKAARSKGVYGFLAKLNSLGLRLIIGELRIERAIDALLEESLKGPKALDCDSIFPKCSKKNAPKIVIEGIIGKTATMKSISQNLRRSRH